MGRFLIRGDGREKGGAGKWEDGKNEHSRVGGGGRGTKAHATQVMWVWERQVALLDSYDNLLST